MKYRSIIELIKFLSSKRLFRFLFIGGICTIFDLILYSTLLKYSNINPGFCSAISFFISANINFNFSNYFTYQRNSEKYLSKIFIFYSASLIGLLISFLVVNVLVSIGINSLLAKIISVIIILFYNYSFHTFITFNSKTFVVIQNIKLYLYEIIFYRAKKHKSFILYSFIGLSGVSLDILSFIIFNNIWKWDLFISAALSVTCGITNNFIWNLKYNFKVKDKIIQRFISFYIVGIIGLSITELVLYVAVKLLNFDTNLAKYVAILLVVFVQYNLNKLISFRTTHTKASKM